MWPFKQKVLTTDGYSSFGAAFRTGSIGNSYRTPSLSRNRVLLDTIYRSSWIAAKVVDALAEDMTKSGIKISGLDSDKEAVLQKYITELQVWHSLTDTIKWARLYGGAAGYIDIAGQDPSTPLDPTTVGKDQFRGIYVLDRFQLTSSGAVNPLTGQSESFNAEIYPGDLHASRFIRLVGVKLPYFLTIENEGWGDSVLERIYSRIIMRDEALSSSGKMINRAWLRTVKINDLRQVLAAGGKAEANLRHMFSVMRDIQDSAGMTVMDNTDTFQTDSFTFTGLDKIINAFDLDLSGASDIPQTRLYGESPAGFSTGESDLKQYYDRVSSIQESMLREPLTLLLTICYQSCFGELLPQKTIDFEFNNIWKNNELEERATVVSEVGAVINAANAGLIDTDKAMISLREVGRKSNLFNSITDEDILANARPEPAPAPDLADEPFSDLTQGQMFGEPEPVDEPDQIIG